MNALSNNQSSEDKLGNDKKSNDPQSHAYQYNQMMDDSKQTEEADISRSDFTETHSQDTMRNLQRASGGKTIDTLDLKKVSSKDQYYNLPEEDQTTRSNLDQQQLRKQGDLMQEYNVYSQEEEKTHDLINNNHIYDDDDYYGHKKNTNGDRRVQTDGNDLEFTSNNLKKSEGQRQPSKTKITSFSLKTHLPQLKINVPLAISSSDIMEIFSTVSKNQRFQVIEMEHNIATAVNKEPFSIKRMFMRCIPFSDQFKRDHPSDSFISAVRLQVSVNEVKCCRKIALKGLYGESTRLSDFINSFKARVDDLIQKTPDNQKLNNSVTVGNRNSSQSRRQVNHNNLIKQQAQRKGMKMHKPKNSIAMMNNHSDDSDSEQKNSGYNETSSLYQIHKILSSDQYSLGKNVSLYLEAFHLQYKSLRESAALLPQPMEGIVSLVNETVLAFNSEYNLGKDTAKSLMPYCRPAVEKYVFQKLYDKLFAMYAIKNEDEDRLFQERAQLIRRSLKPSEIMQYLGIKDKFIIGSNVDALAYPTSNNNSSRFSYLIQKQFTSHGNPADQPRESLPFAGVNETESTLKDQIELSEYESQRSGALIQNNISVNADVQNHIFNNSTTSSSLGLHFINKGDLPYIEAIRCIEKMQQHQSPREKLQCISESFGCMKAAIVDHYKGKLELNTMDDVLPLTIYAVSMADLSHPASEFNIMDDYLRVYDKGFEFERKLLTNFDVSIRYINHEWEISQ